MKYLSNYTEKPFSELFEKMGVFFAFSPKQFEESRVEGVKYRSLGGGSICPADNCKAYLAGVDKVVAECISQDLADNGREGVILRELGNHECYYTGDISDCVDALEDYGINRNEIAGVFSANWETETADRG